jgi:hypothetical protein
VTGVTWPQFSPTSARIVGFVALGTAVSFGVAVIFAIARGAPLGSDQWARMVAARFIDVSNSIFSAFLGAPWAGELEELAEEAEELMEEAGLEPPSRLDPVDVVAEFFTLVWVLFGRAAVALGFFLFWASMHLLAWSYAPAACPANPEKQCAGAYYGVGEAPSLGDFAYLAVNAAFINIPPDVFPASPGAHAVFVAELVTGAAVVTAFAASFLGMRAGAGASVSETAGG